MIFKGIKFRRDKTIVYLGEHPPGTDHVYYAIFGKILNPDKPIPADAVRTDLFWKLSNLPCYAKIIPYRGYSRTNMMYGSDGRTYLILDGKCYVAPKPKVIKNG